MKRYVQSITSNPDLGIRGNSLATCVKCILEFDGTVPNFGVKDDFGPELNKWLRPIGLVYLPIRPQENWAYFGDMGLHIITGQEKRSGLSHSVVGYAGVPFWDPHPDVVGIRGDIGDWTIGVLAMIGRKA